MRCCREIVRKNRTGCHVMASLVMILSMGMTLQAGEVVPFVADWRFHVGPCENGAAADCDDSQWQIVRLPHDWAIAGPFDDKFDGRTGKLPWRGEGWYRKTFTLDAKDRGRRIYLDFDGVMARPRVYVNGELAGQWDYGYMSFRVDATPHVRYGGENTVAVHVDTRQHGSRWYPGAGIYRSVRQVRCDPVHVEHWGVTVTTPQVSDASAVVNVRTEVRNHTGEKVALSLKTTLIDPQGEAVAEAITALSVKATGTGEAEQALTVMQPQRWDIDTPRLYTARVDVVRGGRVCDRYEQPFGIRTFCFTADDGFHLNGRRVNLHGVNLHHDHGPLGAAALPRAIWRRLRMMKDMGVNAVRTSHNPPSPLLLEHCDRMGFVVLNECFDKWDATADLRDQPFESFMARQIRNFVRRDRNHPSVVAWSIGNEMGRIEDNPKGEAAPKVRYVVEQFKSHDPTRPATQGCMWPPACRADNPVFQMHDVSCWNYGRKYQRAREVFPDKPLVYSESASAVSTRGYFALPHPWAKDDFSNGDRQVDSYDLHAAWGPRHIPDWDLYHMETDRYVAGQFVWTGFDYLGEPTPYKQSARSSYYGIVDLCGIPKSRYHLYRSQWNPRATTVHILPHWNWPDRVGRNVPVYVYTNGDSAELFLNGRSLGRRTKQSGELAEPAEPKNLAAGCRATASSSKAGQAADRACDGNADTGWVAADETSAPRWQVDLGETKPLRGCRIAFERELMRYQFGLWGSKDGKQWQPIDAKSEFGQSREKQWFSYAEAEVRYLRVVFTGLSRCSASIREFAAYAEPYGIAGNLPPYYRVIDRYRLRWENVTYQPGELKAVAYQDGEKIGQATMRTAGKPSQLRLTPEWKTIMADGDDLAYVLVEAVDEEGVACPRDNRMVRFAVTGPAVIAGIGNGNPQGMDAYGDDRHPLFFGKAMLILRAQQNRSGEVRICAEADGLAPTQAIIRSIAPASQTR